MSSRKDELLAKKARLAELKRQRELRQEQYAGRQSIGEAPSPGKTAEERRFEIDNLVSSLIDRRRDSTGASSRRQSRPSSGGPPTGHDSPYPDGEPSLAPMMQTVSTQTDPTTASFPIPHDAVAHEAAPPPREYITYSKAVQTEATEATEAEQENEPRGQSDAGPRSSRRDHEREEEIRQNLRKEIEEEIKASVDRVPANAPQASAAPRFPLRTLTSHELNAVVASSDFVAFVERSSKVIERALDMEGEYDLLADYTRTSTLDDSDDDTPYSRGSKKSHSVRESFQLFSDRYSRKRIVSDVHFSPHFNELLLSSYTKNPSAPNEPAGIVLLWNAHAPSRPEYTFTASSDVLSARFSPFHPNLVVGGCYSGQICLWDTRTSGRTGQPVQKTPPSGSHLGHTHPVYSISVIGTPNAHNIVTASMDGVVCSWSVDMLTQAQEYLVLNTPAPAKTDDLAPTCMSFPASDPTFFLVGTEEGSIYPCHRYDRAGAQAGVDVRQAYRGHTAPVMSAQFHPTRGPVDLGDLLLTSSSDWSVKLWRIKAATSTNSAAVTGTGTGTGPTVSKPIVNIAREDLVYDAKWAPYKPSVFACVTGAGDVEVFDLAYDLEVPIAKASPSRGQHGLVPFRGLNKLAWDEKRGSHIAVGGLDGVVTVFDVGRALQCGNGEAVMDDWVGMKRLVSRLESGKT